MVLHSLDVSRFKFTHGTSGFPTSGSEVLLASAQCKPILEGDGRGAGGVREAGEERAGSGSSKRAGSRREMRNANFFNLTIRQNTFKNKNPTYI